MRLTIILTAFLIVMGMVGLHSHVEYSGWVLFLGLIGAAVIIDKNSDDDDDREKSPRDWSFAGWFLNAGTADAPRWVQVAPENSKAPDVIPLGFWVERDIEPELTDEERAEIWQEGYTAKINGLHESFNPYG